MMPPLFQKGGIFLFKIFLGQLTTYWGKRGLWGKANELALHNKCILHKKSESCTKSLCATVLGLALVLSGAGIVLGTHFKSAVQWVIANTQSESLRVLESIGISCPAQNIKYGAPAFKI